MKLTYTFLAPALAAIVSAQSAPGFYITVAQNLGVTFVATNTSVTPPGVLLPRNDVLQMPNITRPANSTGGNGYVAFMIDQDVPRNNSRVPLLHWLQPNLYVSSNASSLYNTVGVANGSTAVGAPYIPPTPPAGSGPHRYTILLFSQPANWAVPASYVSINPPADSSARVGFNITDFVAASGLSSPVAANYFQVLNGTAAETSSASTMTMAAPTTTTSGSGTATSAVASSTASKGAAVEVRGVGRDIAVGLAMGVVGAGLWMI